MVKTIEYNASENDIVAVTVYQYNRAEINRKFKFKHEEEQYEIRFINLSSCIEERSIRVDGVGNANILDVICHQNSASDSALQKPDEILENLRQQEDKIDGDIEIVGHQESVLKSFSTTMDGNSVEIDKLSIYLDMYETRKEKLNARMSKLKYERDIIKKQITRITDAARKEKKYGSRLSTSVTIVLRTTEVGEAELFLTYIVSSAYWMPMYDLRTSFSSNNKGSRSEEISLQYRASVYQTTGENWRDVILTLSTALPSAAARLPNLRPARISFSRERPGVYRHNLSDSGEITPILVPPSEPFIPPRPAIETSSFEVPPYFTMVNSRPSGGAISTAYTIPGKSTITSVEIDKQVTHKVVIADLHFSAMDIEWVTIPTESTDVFLIAKVTNTSEYVLLPGTANIYLDGSFVASSTVPFVNSNERFSCSLGKDPYIRVSSSPETKKVKTVSGSILQSSNKTTTTTFERVVTVKNTRPFKLPRLIVKGQVHISDDEKLKVKIIEPASLSETIKGSVNRISRLNSGIVARWTPREDDNDDTTEDEVDSRRSNGLFEWIVGLEDGESVELRTTWTVSAPHGLKWRRS